MGVVYKARDPLIDRVVAIKTVGLGLSNAETEAYERRFFREAKSAGRLNHPNVVTIHDVGKSGDTAYIAMEFLDGRSLREILDSGVVLPPERIAGIAAQVAAGLAYAHRHEVVHRDVKPANIMVLDNGVVKITDFGIALLPTGTRTLAGNVFGSPRYTSPEQVMGRTVDGRSDIFSLGAVLYEMLTGLPPFSGADLNSILTQVLHDPTPAPSSHNRSLPRAFDHIVAKALAKDPGDRYQDAEEMATDLRNFAGVELSSSAPGPLPPLEHPTIAGTCAGARRVRARRRGGAAGRGRRTRGRRAAPAGLFAPVLAADRRGGAGARRAGLVGPVDATACARARSAAAAAGVRRRIRAQCQRADPDVAGQRPRGDDRSKSIAAPEAPATMRSESLRRECAEVRTCERQRTTSVPPRPPVTASGRGEPSPPARRSQTPSRRRPSPSRPDAWRSRSRHGAKSASTGGSAAFRRRCRKSVSRRASTWSSSAIRRSRRFARPSTFQPTARCASSTSSSDDHAHVPFHDGACAARGAGLRRVPVAAGVAVRDRTGVRERGDTRTRAPAATGGRRATAADGGATARSRREELRGRRPQGRDTRNSGRARTRTRGARGPRARAQVPRVHGLRDGTREGLPRRIPDGARGGSELRARARRSRPSGMGARRAQREGGPREGRRRSRRPKPAPKPTPKAPAKK